MEYGKGSFLPRICITLQSSTLRRLLTIAVMAFTSLALSYSTAWADSKCRDGVSLTVQGANTVMEHAADKVNKKALPKLREYVPTAEPFDLNRPEFLITLNYDRQVRDYLKMRVYGGFSVSPDTVVYDYTGEGFYEGNSIGDVQARIRDHGYLYVLGNDWFLQSGKCGDTVRFIGGLGIAAIAYHGGIDAEFIPLILGDRPYLTLHGTYWGVGAYASAMAGVQFQLHEHVDLTLLGGYRAGIGYISFESDIESKDGPLPIYGPFGQVNLGIKF